MSRRRRVVQLLKAAPLALLWGVSALLPVAWASRAGGALLGALGPRARKHRHVRRNIGFVLPEAADAELERTARGVWRNFGAVLAEYPHLGRIVRQRCELAVPPEVQRLFDQRRPALFVSGHVGNWEIIAPFLTSHARGLVLVYSRDPNPFVEAMLQRLRRLPKVQFVDKDEALRQMMAAPGQALSVGLLPDQRVDSGVLLPLFQVPAPTTISPARIAQRIGYPVVPVHAERLPGARFRIVFHPPLTPEPGTSGREAAVSVTRQFNALLEGWIRQRPQEWLCTKRRWPKTAARPTPADAGAAAPGAASPADSRR